MDARTGEVWMPSDVESAEKKVTEGRIDDLTESEKRYILANDWGMVAWITPEVAEQVRLGQMAKLTEIKQDFETRLREKRLDDADEG